MTTAAPLDPGGPILIAGAGAMGGALIEGWLREGLSPAHLFVQDPAPPEATAARLARSGVRVAPSFEDIPRLAAILVAVKPQVMDSVLPELARRAGPETLVISIAAGRRIEDVARHFPPATAIVRAMPNTPAAIGRGMTVLCKNASVSPVQEARCAALFDAAGKTAWIADEGLMDAVTAVSGSGPAYVFFLTECLAEAGRAAGLDAALAERLARATVSGAGEMLETSDATAADLRAAVTSPAGATAAALAVLMAHPGLNDLMTRAVAAAAKRARELGS